MSCMRKSLAMKYGEQTVALGGVFNITKGSAKLHVMVNTVDIMVGTVCVCVHVCVDSCRSNCGNGS